MTEVIDRLAAAVNAHDLDIRPEIGDGSSVGSGVVEVYSKKLDYQPRRHDLNRRSLDPQSRSGRRWAWLSVAQWALDQA